MDEEVRWKLKAWMHVGNMVAAGSVGTGEKDRRMSVGWVEPKRMPEGGWVWMMDGWMDGSCVDGQRSVGWANKNFTDTE